MSLKGKLVLAALGLVTMGVALSAAAQQIRSNPVKGKKTLDSFDPMESAERSAARRSPRTSADTGAQQSAHVSIEIIGPASASTGIPSRYELVARNQGANVVEHVRVEAEVPEGAEFVSATPAAEIEDGTATWILDRLEPGRERRVEMQLRPTDEGPLECHAMVTCMAVSSTQTTVSRPRLALAMTAPPETKIGQVVPFTLKISNPGSGPAQGVVVHDMVPGGLDHPSGREIEYEVGTLAAGESRQVQLDLSTIAPGAQTNRAEVTAEGGLRAVAEATVQVLEPRLTLKKTGPKRRYLERPATYSIVVSNPGSATASNISVTDELPDGVVFVEASNAGRLGRDNRNVRWSIDQLDPGEVRTLSLTVRPTAPGEFCTLALATADDGLRAEAEACTAVEGISALLLEVVDLEDPIEAGAETTYEVRVVNQGSQAATNVVIRATAPKGMSPLEADGPVPYSVRGQEVVFHPLARLAARADAAYYVHVRGDQAGDLRFRVSLMCDQLDTPVNKEESTRVFSDE